MKQMRPSRILRKLRDGGIVKSTKLNLTDAKAADLAGHCGFDCIWVCMEHVPASIEQINHQIMAAKMHDMDTVVRVERGSYSDLVRPLEMDAAGIIVPHVMSAADARQIARQVRFHPLGLRPVDGGNADGAYTMIDFDDYIRQANDQRFVIVQIEDVEALDELDAIAQVEGIDGLFFGPADFSQSIGAPGKWDDPRIADARRRVAEAANRHGKFAVTPVAVDQIAEHIDMGYRWLQMGADVLGLSSYFTDLAEACDRGTRGR